MESGESAPSTLQQLEPMGEEGEQEGAQTAAQQPHSVEVEETSLSPQEHKPQGAEGFEPTAVQHPEPMLTNEGAPATAQQPETTGATDGRQAFDQQSGSSSAVHTIVRSMSAPSTLHSWIVNQSPSLQGSASGSSSDWISDATDTTHGSSASLPSNRARHNGHIHTDGSENGNGAGSSGILRQDTDSQMESQSSLSTDASSREEATQTDEPHGTSSESTSVSRKDSTVTNTSSMSLNFSVTSSGTDPKSDILGSRRSSILDTDEDELDEMTFLTPLMNLVEAYSDYFKEVEHLQAEEYIMTMIKSYVEIATTSTADMHSIARAVFGSTHDAESTGRESPYQMTEERVERSELSASLERRLQAVRDYVRTTSDATTEAAIAEMIIQEYNAEMIMAESGDLPDVDSPSTQEATSDVAHEGEVQDGGVKQGGKTYSDSNGATGGVKEVQMEGISAEGKDSPMQTASGSVKREREVQAEEAVGVSKVKMGTTKEESEWSRSLFSRDSDVERMEYLLSSHYEQLYPESKRQRKIRKSHQKAAVLKIFSLAQARVCVIRTMNWVMLRCLKTVTAVVNLALEANTVAHRAISHTEALRSAGTSGDFIAALAESATAASQCAETAVREIEEAVQLHKLVVDALNATERALFNIKTETCDGVDLIRHLFLGVELIELQVTRACRTYLDKARDSPDSGGSFVFPTSDGIHGPIVSMAFVEMEDGPSDVFQALIWACQSSVNAMEMMVKGLEDFSTAKLKRRISDK